VKSVKTLYLDAAGIAIAVSIALCSGLAVILATSDEPLTALASLLLEPLSDPFHIGTILNKAVPLILTGLALCVVFQSGVFSMGAEGQLHVGAFAGALAGISISGWPAWIHLPFVLVCAVAGGALFAAVAGVLKALWNANEIVTTLMLNFIAVLTISYFVNNPLKDPESGGFARMAYLDKGLLLSKPIPGFPVHMGIAIALVMVAVVALLLYTTAIGYELRLVGKNRIFARYGGIATRRAVIVGMMISGGLAGLAGVVEVLGIHGTYKDQFSAGLGFDGIIIAILARNHPVGVLVAALVYAYIQVGAQTMQVGSDMPREVAVIIQVMMVLLVSSPSIFAFLKHKYGQKAVN